MIKLIYSIIGIIGILFLNFSCDAPQANNSNTSPETVSTVRIPKEETPFVREEQKTELVKSVSRIQNRKVVKDSLNEVKAHYTISDEIIDSLNKIVPLYDKESYNQLAISYFSTLADSLHGRSYYADNSDAVMLSVMEVLTSRINEGTDIVFFS